jgi:hypothetical protein
VIIEAAALGPDAADEGYGPVMAYKRRPTESRARELPRGAGAPSVPESPGPLLNLRVADFEPATFGLVTRSSPSEEPLRTHATSMPLCGIRALP